MSIVKITRVEDIQPGDRVTLTHNDTTVVGTVRDVAHGVEDGYWTFVSATREVPDLPTEVGSVIVNATIRGETGHTAILDDGGVWFTPRPVGAVRWEHRPEHITAWEPARIVPESEVGRSATDSRTVTAEQLEAATEVLWRQDVGRGWEGEPDAVRAYWRRDAAAVLAAAGFTVVGEEEA